MPSGVAEPPPIRFSFPSDLAKFDVPLDKFVQAHGGDGFVAVSALVFHGSRLLLVQRAAHDSWPGMWESPGGAVEVDDETILHALTRELWEESGLVATRINRLIDQSDFVTTKGRTITKYTFQVEVQAEMADDCNDVLPPQVTLDPNEHQNYRWCTEEECFAAKPGQVLFETIVPGQKQTLLVGFSRRREDSEQKET
jgi:8-oxo-dGTP pyrophosphatase MutT (NUDIX family)